MALVADTQAASDQADDGQVDLTPRQQQILALLQKGKSNKEIAADLGIGLGTVKQHINVLFKRLDVRNRTMAVTRGQAMQAPAAPQTAAPARSGLSELRPAPILSLSLPAPVLEHLIEDSAALGGAEESTANPFHRTLAAVASDFGGVLVPRADGGDLVFGVPRCREQDILRALRAAFSCARNRGLESVAGHLQAGLEIGEIGVGVAHGGTWDGEILAGPLLGRARDLAATAPAGSLMLGDDAQVLAALLCGTADGLGAPLPLGEDLTLSYRLPEPPRGLRGRVRERATLENDVDALRTGQGQTIMIEGEAGIGKTALLSALPALCRRHGQRFEAWRCLPPDGQPLTPARGRLMNTADGRVITVSQLIEHLTDEDAAAVIGLDDIHWLPFDRLPPLFDAIAAAAQQGRLVVTTGRPVVSAAVGLIPRARHFRLGRLDRTALEALCDDTAQRPLRPDARAAICDKALGVPLFAIEMVRALNASGTLPLQPPLTVLALLVARIDALHLDRRLLRLIAHGTGPQPIDNLRTAWEDTDRAFDAAVDGAVASGLLSRNSRPTPTVAVGHPMILAALDHMMTAAQPSGGGA